MFNFVLKMQQITLEIKPNKLPFFLELIRNFDFVKVKNVPQDNREMVPDNNIKKDYKKITKNTENTRAKYQSEYTTKGIRTEEDFFNFLDSENSL